MAPRPVVCVHDHKTGREGTAKLVLDGVDFNRLRQYIVCVRPLQDSENSSKFVIVLSGGKQLNKVATRIRRLGNHYGLTLPTPTRVRKIGATTVSLNVGTAPEAALITRQLSHAARTEQQYNRPSLVMSMHQWPIQQWNRCTKGSRLLVRNAKPRSHYLLRSRNVAKLRKRTCQSRTTNLQGGR